MDEGFSIRAARPGEQDVLTGLCMRSKQSQGYDDAFMAQCADELRVHDDWIRTGDFWVAEAPDGAVIGCIRLQKGPDTGYGELSTCFVDPDWQGRRVGRAMFDRLWARVRQIGLKTVGVDADPNAEAFYARMGFRTIGRSPSGSIPGRTLPRMERLVGEN